MTGDVQLGPAHPVAQQAVHAIRKARPFAFELGDQRGCPGDLRRLERGITVGVIGVKMGQIDARDRLAGQLFCKRGQIGTIAQRRTRIDQHCAVRGIKDRDVGDRAAIAHQDRVVGAAHHPDAIGDDLRFQAISKRGCHDRHCCNARQAAADECSSVNQRPAPCTAAFTVAAVKVPAYSMPLVSRPSNETDSPGLILGMSVRTGSSATDACI